MSIFRNILERSLSSASSGNLEKALLMLNSGIEVAVKEKEERWIVILSKNAGVVCEHLGMLDEAIQHYKRSLKYDRHDPYIHYSLGELYGRLNKKTSSRRYFRSCYKLARATEDSDLLAILSRKRKTSKLEGE